MFSYYILFVSSYSLLSLFFFLIDVFSYKFKTLGDLKIDKIKFEEMLDIYILKYFLM